MSEASFARHPTAHNAGKIHSRTARASRPAADSCYQSVSLGSTLPKRTWNPKRKAYRGYCPLLTRLYAVPFYLIWGSWLGMNLLSKLLGPTPKCRQCGCQDSGTQKATKSYNPKHYGPPQVDIIWGIWGSCYNMPKAIFYLLN